MGRWIDLLLAAAAASAAPCQELLWQVPSPPSTTIYYGMASFADFDHDGVRDFLQLVLLDYQGVNPRQALQICSGLDGSVLWGIENYDVSSTHAFGSAGDMDGDGEPEIVLPRFTSPMRSVEVLSPTTGQVLWNVWGPWSGLFGEAILGDLDTDGDGTPDLVTITSHSSASDVYVYDSFGTLRYTVPCLSQGRVAVSLAKLQDLDSDGCDEFVVGCTDASTRGVLMVVSGLTGAVLRDSYGLLPGDLTSDHASNLGDIDGDGVDDYAGFPWFTASRNIVVAYSGATGAVLRTWWPEFANSVVTGLDFDLDGVPDLAMGADWFVSPQVWGSTRVYSGRDGERLWQVDNFWAPQGTGNNGSNGWMDGSAAIGPLPGNPYPAFAWLDTQFYSVGTVAGRIRSYRGVRAGQGPVLGKPCGPGPELPQIGVRVAPAGSRITIAKGASGAFAWLNLGLPVRGGGLAPMPFATLGPAACPILVTPAWSYFRVLGTSGVDRGYAAVDFPFQLTPATTGTALAAQWLVFDPATLTFASTARHDLLAQ